jgi:D-aminoacyl-tRNA deacylase
LRALLQRVKQASVEIDQSKIASIGEGLLVFLGVEENDTPEDFEFLLKKIPSLRIFSDAEGKMNRSVQEVNGKILVVSQFTLLADTTKGNRPSFFRAAKPEKAQLTYQKFILKLREQGLVVQEGKFGADMQVSLLNDGPVTILLDSREPR